MNDNTLNPTSLSAENMTGLVLAGGQSLRMGGTDKAWLRCEPNEPTLVEQVVARLRPQVSALYVSSRQSHAQYAQLGLSCIADRIEGYAGPLAGLHAALCTAQTDWVLTVPCDAPLLPLNLAAKLSEALLATASSKLAAVACDESGLQPTFALVHCQLAKSLEEYLLSGQRRAGRWFEEMGAVRVVFDEPYVFSNINTPQDLANLKRAAP